MFKETGDSRYIYQNETDKACFQDNMAYGDLKDLPRARTSDKVYYIVKHLELLKTQKMLDINVDLLLWLINFLIESMPMKLLVLLLTKGQELILKTNN